MNFIEQNGPVFLIQEFALGGNKLPAIGRVDVTGTIRTAQAYIMFEMESAIERELISWVQDVSDSDRQKIYTV